MKAIVSRKRAVWYLVGISYESYRYHHGGRSPSYQEGQVKRAWPKGLCLLGATARQA